jgi:golgin subfamily B member 1
LKSLLLAASFWLITYNPTSLHVAEEANSRIRKFYPQATLALSCGQKTDKLHLLYAKHNQIESHVKDMETHLEQLTEQLMEKSLFMGNNIAIYHSVIKDMDTKYNMV